MQTTLSHAIRPELFEVLSLWQQQASLGFYYIFQKTHRPKHHPEHYLTT
tara:strand:+ start:55 stop:201 length:147 start_codon:yes stop_codon:yes gene_type:complete